MPARAEATGVRRQAIKKRKTSPKENTRPKPKIDLVIRAEHIAIRIDQEGGINICLVS